MAEIKGLSVLIPKSARLTTCAPTIHSIRHTQFNDNPELVKSYVPIDGVTMLTRVQSTETKLMHETNFTMPNTGAEIYGKVIFFGEIEDGTLTSLNNEQIMRIIYMFGFTDDTGLDIAGTYKMIISMRTCLMDMSDSLSENMKLYKQANAWFSSIKQPALRSLIVEALLVIHNRFDVCDLYEARRIFLDHIRGLCQSKEGNLGWPTSQKDDT